MRFEPRSAYLRKSAVCWVISWGGDTSMRWVAKWRCRKKVSRSTSGLRVRIISSHHESTRSVSDS